MPAKKKAIPKALRDQVWLKHMGKVYEGKCKIRWCSNTMNVTNFHCGHNVPESKGGATDLNNLIPICSNCNTSMSNVYTIDEWNKLGRPASWWCCGAAVTPIDPSKIEKAPQ